MKKIYLVASLSILLFQYTLSGLAQKTIYGRRLYGPDFSVNAYCAGETKNHSLIIGGDNGGKAMVLSLDQSGLIQWSKTIGQSAGSFSAMTSTFDSCFVLAGDISKPSGPGHNCFVVKLTTSGDTVWTRQIDMGGSDHVNSIKETQDHGFILSGNASDSRVIVTRLNNMGFLIWGKSYACGSKFNTAYYAEQMPDSGYIVSGFIQNYAPGDAGIFLMKLTLNGKISWAKKRVVTVGEYSGSLGSDLLVVPGGIITYSTMYYNRVVVIKTDLEGHLLWSKYYYFYVDYGIRPRIIPSPDMGYLMIHGNYQGFYPLIKIDTAGNILWNKEVYSIATDIVVTRNDSLIIVGNGPVGANSSSYPGPQIAVIKCDSAGQGTFCIGYEPEVPTGDYPMTLQPALFNVMTAGSMVVSNLPINSIVMNNDDHCAYIEGAGKIEDPFTPDPVIFPSPADDFFTLDVKGIKASEINRIDLYSSSGEKIEIHHDVNQLPVRINARSLSNGIYYVRIMLRNGIVSGKVLIMHM